MRPEDGPELLWLGRVPYAEALQRQRERREAIVAGQAREALWLLEHDPVITTGRRAVDGLDPARLGMEVVQTERGGLATYHGPGQLVGYLLLDVGSRGGSVRGTVCAVEAGLMAWLDERLPRPAARREGHPGVWVGKDKIAAIGLHFRRGVSMHGFALNLTVDLERFRGFVPCGVEDGGVTSLQRELGRSAASLGRSAASLGRSPGPPDVALEVGGRVLQHVLSAASSRAACAADGAGPRE
jgi:lipoyl(octanoyl) transferase